MTTRNAAGEALAVADATAADPSAADARDVTAASGASPSDAARTGTTPSDSTPLDADLAARYRPVFAEIAEGALDRERSRTLPFAAIDALKRSGFLAVRVPREFGGDGATIPQLFALLAELAAADPHVVQALRGHLAFVEDRLVAAPSGERDAWLRRFAAGEMVGNAWTETGSVALGATATRLARDEHGPGFTLTGTKFYTTGSIFAEWIDATATGPDGSELSVLVATDSPRVTISDDWDGFGQKLTGSGTTVFDAAPVQAEHVYDFNARFSYQTALYQAVLIAVQAGIARAASREVAGLVAARTRSYSTGNTPLTRNDPQILEVVGRVDAAAFAVDALLEKLARSLQREFEAQVAVRDGVLRRGAIPDAAGRVPDAVTLADLHTQTELDSARAQIVANDLVLGATTQLFDALGASAASSQLALDRHWRNARTVASHNPVVFKARIVGDWAVNGTEPPYEWSVGVPPAAVP